MTSGSNKGNQKEKPKMVRFGAVLDLVMKYKNPMYGNKENAKSWDAMLWESMVGAHGSTGNGNPHTIPLLFLQVFDSVILLLRLRLRLFTYSCCRNLVVGGFRNLGGLQRDKRGRDKLIVAAISILFIRHSNSTLFYLIIIGTVQLSKQAGPVTNWPIGLPFI